MSKTVVDELLKFTVIINGDQSKKELYDLEKANTKLKESNKSLLSEKAKLVYQEEKNSEAYKNLTREIKANNATIKSNENKMQTLTNKIGITGLSINQLNKEAARLRLQLRHMVPGSEDFIRYQAQLKQVQNQLAILNGRASSAKFSISNLANGFNKYAALGASVIATLTGVALSIQKIIDYNGKLSDAQSDVMKTTGLTKKEVDELSVSFGLLKTRTARIELLKLAEEAGRLGIEGKKNVLDFVEVANQLKVALGDDLSEEQIREVGKIANIYKIGEKEGKDFKDSMMALGSAINEVSASGANQASYLVDYLKRQAGVSAQVNLSAQDNLAYAATFDEIGQSVEVSATAMNKIWMDMFTNTATYAKIAGMSVADFSNLLKTDSNEAMIKFLEGLNGNNQGMEVMIKKLEDLDVGGVRGAQSLSALAGNTELLRKRQEQSNIALSEATSLTNEYNLKNNNLAGTLDKIKKKVVGWFSSDGLVSFLTSAAKGFAKLIGATEDSTKALEKERLEVLMLEVKIKDINITKEERIRLIKEFQKNYPGYLKNLNAEKVTNQELSNAIKEVNKDLVNKIILQRKDEEVKEEAEKVADKRLTLVKKQNALEAELAKIADKRNIKLQDNVSLEKQASDILNANNKHTARISGGYRSLSGALGSYVQAQKAYNEANREMFNVEKEKQKLIKDLNIKTTPNKTPTDDPKPTDPNKPLNPNQPLDTSVKDKMAQLKKESETLLDINRQTEDARIKLIQNSFAREFAENQINHQRKIEDLQHKAEEIQSLKDKAILSGNTDLANIFSEQYKAINQQLELAKEEAQNNSLDNLLQSLKNEFKAEEEARLQNYQNQLNDAANNEEAIKQIKEDYKKESAQRERAHVQELSQILQSLADPKQFEGFNFEILTDEQQQQIKARLQELGLELTEINKLLASMQSGQPKNQTNDISNILGSSGNIDILGFTAEQWGTTFSNLDTTKQKLEAAYMTLSGMFTAYQMFSNFQTEAENARLRNLERTNNKDKQELDRLLANKLISQRQHNDAINAADKKLEKEKEKIAKKQAQRERVMTMASIALNTAQAIMSIWAQVPKRDFGISAGLLTAFVSALGAAQLLAASKIKGYQSGFYNNTMQVRRDQDGKVFNANFGGQSRSGMVDKPTVFMAGEGGKNFPEMIISGPDFKQFSPELTQSLYRELGRIKGFENGYYPQPQSQNTTKTEGNILLLDVLNKVVNVLERIEENGIEAYIPRNFTNTKRLRDDINRLQTIENNAKINK